MVIVVVVVEVVEEVNRGNATVTSYQGAIRMIQMSGGSAEDHRG
jgi:hypothetical protein